MKYNYVHKTENTVKFIMTMQEIKISLLDNGEEVTARPRRMSEYNMANKKEPIPAGSAFFIFSSTNRYRIGEFHQVNFRHEDTDKN